MYINDIVTIAITEIHVSDTERSQGHSGVRSVVRQMSGRQIKREFQHQVRRTGPAAPHQPLMLGKSLPQMEFGSFWVNTGGLSSSNTVILNYLRLTERFSNSHKVWNKSLMFLQWLRGGLVHKNTIQAFATGVKPAMREVRKMTHITIFLSSFLVKFSLFPWIWVLYMALLF